MSEEPTLGELYTVHLVRELADLRQQLQAEEAGAAELESLLEQSTKNCQEALERAVDLQEKLLAERAVVEAAQEWAVVERRFRETLIVGIGPLAGRWRQEADACEVAERKLIACVEALAKHSVA